MTDTTIAELTSAAAVALRADGMVDTVQWRELDRAVELHGRHGDSRSAGRLVDAAAAFVDRVGPCADDDIAVHRIDTLLMRLDQSGS